MENSCDAAVLGTGRQTQRLTELIGLHRTALLKYVKRILNSQEDAEDVVQETYMRLLRISDLWRGEREVRAFLFKIATNLARDELRRRKSRGYGMHMPYDSIELAGENQPVEEVIDHNTATEVIARTLSSLPPRYSVVFKLHVESYMSYREIARHLGISTKTVERDMCGAQELCHDRLIKGNRAVAA
ncbi:MAG: RNA polymerase sigma factor [Pseudomonadota bacterium]